MLSFDVLLAINFACALIALARLRGATFVILANVCAMLRALSNIDAVGQPRSLSYLPPSVFDPARLATAANIFLIVTPIALVAVCWPDPPNKEPVQLKPLPKLPRWLLVLVAIYFIGLALSTRTILAGAYSDTSRSNFEMPQGGVMTLLEGLVVYEIYRRHRAGLLSVARAFVLLFGFLFVAEYSKGASGSATGFLFMAAFLFLGHQGRVWTRPVKVGGVLVAVAAFTVFLRTARQTLYIEGVGSVATASAEILRSEETRAEDAQGIEYHANAVQYAAHILECANLYDAGYSREWRSLYQPIVYTFQPKFLMTWLDLERDIEAPWELGEYFVHCGGIAIFGEMYWNGGYPCVLLTTMAVFLLAYLGDTRRDRSFGWLIFYCLYASIMLLGVGYGLSYLFRGIFNTLIVMALHKLFTRLSSHPRQDEGPSGVSEMTRATLALSDGPRRL